MICSTILSTTFNFPSTSVLFMYCKIWSPTFINVPRKMTQNKNGSPNNKKCYFSQKLKIIFNIILIIDLFNEKWLLILEMGATLENVNLHLITRYTVFCPQNVYHHYVFSNIGVDSQSFPHMICPKIEVVHWLKSY